MGGKAVSDPAWSTPALMVLGVSMAADLVTAAMAASAAAESSVPAMVVVVAPPPPQAATIGMRTSANASRAINMT